MCVCLIILCTVQFFSCLILQVIILTSSGSGFCSFHTRRACQEPEHCTQRSRKKEKLTQLCCWTWQDRLTKSFPKTETGATGMNPHFPPSFQEFKDLFACDKTRQTVFKKIFKKIILLSRILKFKILTFGGRIHGVPIPSRCHTYTSGPRHWHWYTSYSGSINLLNQTQGHLGLYIIKNVMRISGINNNMQNAFNPFGHIDHCRWCSAPNPSINF